MFLSFCVGTLRILGKLPTKNAWKINKRLDKIVDLSQRYNCDCQPEDVVKIFETIEKSVATAKERLTLLHENAKG